MNNRSLTTEELDKIYALYYNYGKPRLGEFIQMIWEEAYDLGRNDERSSGQRVERSQIESSNS
jgi:hypothetical protein